MSERPDTSGPQFRADRPVEQEAVRTTIVGGRPPGSGQSLGPIPRGIEVLVKKASVDPAFKQILLEERAGAADRIGLGLDPAEVMMLRAVPAAQLEAIIARTHVPQEHRRALGKAAAVMLAALGLTAAGCGREAPTKGIQPERPTTGIKPERPPERPERLEPTKGIEPDRPPGPRQGPEPKIVEPAKAAEPPKPESTGEPKPAEPKPKPKENTLRPEHEASEPDSSGKNPLRPDKIPAPTGSRPDPPAIRGIRPDRPAQREDPPKN